MKTNLLKLFCVLVIVILLVYVSFKTKEPFYVTQPPSFALVDSEGGNIINEYTNFNGFEKIIDPIDPNNVLKFNKLENNSSFMYKRKNTKTDFTVGFYFKTDNNEINNNYLFSAEDDNENEVMRIDLKEDNIKIVYEENELKIPKDQNMLETDDTEYSYLVLKADIKNDEFVPKLSIIYNSKTYEMTLKNKEAQELSLSKFIFGNLKNEPNGFKGLIGKIVIMNELIGSKQLCNIYNCKLNCFEPTGSKDYDGNVNNCIKDCMTSCGDIQKCQKICINCEIEGQFWDNEEKLKRCPWLSEIKIMDQSIPEAPIIRGYPGDGKILIEWKKPFDGRSKITNYIILYYEAFNKKNGINVSISGQSDLDILEHELTNLKNKTFYDIEIRAVNSVGIGKPSNIISIAPNGNIVTNNNRNIFNELEEELQKEVENTQMDFMCNTHNFDSVGHTLDYYDEDMTDIKNYIEKLK
jgi:hypothetical protein